MNVFSSYQGLSKEAKYLIYQSILPSVAYGMFFTDVSYFLTSVQGLSYSLMGAIITTMGIATFVASIPLGIIADKYGRKQMLILGNLIAGAILVVFAFTANPIALIAAAVFEGISEAAFSASSGAMLAERAEATKRNSVFSLYGFANSLAFGIGGLAVPAIVIFELVGFSNNMSHSLLYVTLAALSLGSTILLLKVKEKDKTKKTKEPSTNDHAKSSHKRSRSIITKYVLTGAIIAIGAGMVVPLMAAWLKARYGIPDVVSAPLLGVVSIVIAVATLAGPALAKRFGLTKAIVTTQALSTVFMFVTPLSPSYAIATSVYTTRAFLMNMASPLSQSMIMGLVDEDERGMASGINTALWRLPNALSSYFGAYLISIGLLSAPFFVASLLYLLSIVLFWYFFRKIKMPEEETSLKPVRAH
jgi:MFS family permease